jgi:asparagine synthase (glutamine-hydrolysing)
LNEALARVPELVTLYCLRRELLLPEQRRRLHELPAQSDPLTGLPHPMLESLRNAHAKASVLDRIAHLELATYMRHMLLRDADAFSMAQPIELRLPFLEHAVVEAVARASSRFRKGNEPPKPLLLDAVGSRVPKVVTNGKKRGFTFPWDAWLRGPLRAHASSALAEPGVWRDLGVDARATAQLWERFEKREPSAPALAVLGLLVLSDFSRRHQLRM